MAQKIDLTGARFGRLVYVRDVSQSPRRALWKCDCGNEHIATVSSVKFRPNSACGCRLKEYQAAGTVATHRRHNTPEYKSWTAMKQRCRNPNDGGFPRYGGRGIDYCERWESFENFFADMGPRPEGMTLDRIDNDGPYSPDNCRWATKRTQQANRGCARLITHNGETRTINDWARIKGLLWSTIEQRLAYGWSVAEALERPPIPPSERGGLRKRKPFQP